MKPLKIHTVKMIQLDEWNGFVCDVYKRPYNLQQQDGCRQRGTIELTVPDGSYDDEIPTSIPEIVNGPDMSVRFASWLERDPAQQIPDDSTGSWKTALWWERNFYPELQVVANDLHTRGLLEAGDYVINIDW